MKKDFSTYINFMRLTVTAFCAVFFLMQSHPAHAFTFGAAGDYANGSNFNATANAAGSNGLDFYMTLGDNSYSSGSEQSWCSTLMSKVSNVALIAGNHDAGESSGGDINKYRQTCKYTASTITGDFGKQYYFDYPATNPIARFIMIVPGIGGSINISYANGGAGYTFTSNAIDDARSKGIKWIIVGMHKNYISAMEKNNEVGNDLMPMLFNKKVDLILQGHEHGYERTKQLTCATPGSYSANCVSSSTNAMKQGAGSVIAVLGTGGQGLRGLNTGDAEYPYFAASDNTTNGFGKFTITASSIAYSFVRSAGGNLSDSFTITANAAAPSVNPSPSGVVPTLYCLGGVPCTSPVPTNLGVTNGPVTTGGASQAPSATGGVNPTTGVPQPTVDPCTTDTSVMANSKRHMKSRGGFFARFIEWILKIFQWLLEKLGIQLPNPGTPTPNPDPGISPDPTGEPQPTTAPCPSPTVAQQPTTVPSTAPSTAPSTGVSATPPASTGARDPLKQPFASNSIWNMPIGSNAKYVAANLPDVPRGEAYAPMPQIDDEHIVLKPTAPLVTINYSDAAWSGKNRCNATGGSKDGLPVQVPIPSNYLVPHDNTNSMGVFLLADGRTVIQTQPLARCSAGGDATSVVKVPNADLYGDGIVGAHGGSNMSALGGSIRVGELRPGGQPMHHAIKVNVDSPLVLYPCKTQSECFRWPALKADSGAAGDYGSINPNPNPALKMGSLLAIPKSTDINSLGLQSEPGKSLAWTLQNYGAYIVDSTGGAAFAISAENGPDGNKRTEFKQDWGMEFEGRVNDNTPWTKDMQKLVKALYVVDNNTASSIGGGGTPLQPLAPAIAPK